MMDYEKLVEELRRRAMPKKPFIAQGEIWTGGMVKDELCAEAATALSTLQAENEKLRAELESKEKYYEQMIDALSATDSADLARVTAERDAAVSDIENALAYGLKDCELCVNVQCYVRGGTKSCFPKWRGPNKEA